MPFEFTNNVAFYHSELIDPKEKGIVFSDGLTVKKAIARETYRWKNESVLRYWNPFYKRLRRIPVKHRYQALQHQRVPVAKIGDNPIRQWRSSLLRGASGNLDKGDLSFSGAINRSKC